MYDLFIDVKVINVINVALKVAVHIPDTIVAAFDIEPCGYFRTVFDDMVFLAASVANDIHWLARFILPNPSSVSTSRQQLPAAQQIAHVTAQ